MTTLLPRVMLKLSGEVLAGKSGAGLDMVMLDQVAGELCRATRKGARAAVVLGGGNIFRGLGEAARGMDRVSADQMGMLATVINGLANVDALSRAGGQGKLFTAFPVGPIGELYTPLKAREALDQNIITVLSGGTGNPFFSTDSAAALRAAELGCSVFFKGTKVDGLYDKDPMLHSDAIRLDQINIDELLERRLGVMDLTAATLCRENGIDIRIYRMVDKDAIQRAASGEPLGSLVIAQNSLT
jgi:uridylate kinase